MIVTGRQIVREYFARHAGRKGLRAAERRFDAWWAEAASAMWSDPMSVTAHYRAANILKGSRVVFNISGNNYRLVVKINYLAQVVEIRFFGGHRDYDRIDAEAI